MKFICLYKNGGKTKEKRLHYWEKKKNNIMKSAEKERRAFLVSNGLFSLDFNSGW